MRISLGIGRCKPTSDVGLIDEEKQQCRIQSGDNKQSINCGIKSRAKEEKIMKAIELRAALIAANDVNLNGADALVETSILKQLIASCEARMDELEREAKEMALTHTKSGQFTHEGHTYELQENVTFDFMGKPQKYTMPEGVTFRQKTAEQKSLKSQSSAITKALKAIKDAFPITHPNIEPDEVTYVLKCIE